MPGYKQFCSLLVVSLAAFLSPTATASSQCTHSDGHVYNVGTFYSPDPCTECECTATGQRCAITDCPPLCVDPVNVEGQCCPSCPNGTNCEEPYTGVIIPRGPDPVAVDGLMCQCSDHSLFAVCYIDDSGTPPTPPPMPV